MFLASPPSSFARLLQQAFICMLVAMLSGCSKSPASGGAAGKAGRGGGAPVVVGKAQRKIVPLVIDAIGTVEPLRTTLVRSQVTGTLHRIAIEEGQDVLEGDLLFEIDPRPFQNTLQAARADNRKVLVQHENALAQVARYRALSTEQMVSQEQFQKIQDDARALEAELLAAESRVANAELQLEYCSIRAPLAGRTGNIDVDEGDLVRANESAALVTINQVSPVNVSFAVPQQYLAAINRYRAGRPLMAAVQPPGIDGPPASGELSFVDNAVDPATGTIRLKARIDNENHMLWPGQFATVTLTLAEPEVLTVPTAAVQNAQEGSHVFVVSSDNVAQLRPVVIERTLGDDAVVVSGLVEGETVVVDGQLRVVPGQPVDIKLAGAPAVSPPKPSGTAKTGGTGQTRS